MVKKLSIDRLKIKGFKSLQDVDLELGKLNVLIGPNGGGKSNLISYFDMLRELVEGRLRRWTAKQGGANSVLTFGAKHTEQIISRLEFGNNFYEFELEPNNADRFDFVDERTGYGDVYPQGCSIGKWHEESC